MNIEEPFSFKKLLKGFVSIKFLVWIAATVFFARGMLPAEWWMVLSGGFMGANVAQDFRRNGK